MEGSGRKNNAFRNTTKSEGGCGEGHEGEISGELAVLALGSDGGVEGFQFLDGSETEAIRYNATTAIVGGDDQFRTDITDEGAGGDAYFFQQFFYIAVIDTFDVQESIGGMAVHVAFSFADGLLGEAEEAGFVVFEVLIFSFTGEGIGEGGGFAAREGRVKNEEGFITAITDGVDDFVGEFVAFLVSFGNDFFALFGVCFSNAGVTVARFCIGNLAEAQHDLITGEQQCSMVDGVHDDALIADAGGNETAFDISDDQIFENVAFGAFTLERAGAATVALFGFELGLFPNVLRGFHDLGNSGGGFAQTFLEVVGHEGDEDISFGYIYGFGIFGDIGKGIFGGAAGFVIGNGVFRKQVAAAAIDGRVFGVLSKGEFGIQIGSDRLAIITGTGTAQHAFAGGLMCRMVEFNFGKGEFTEVKLVGTVKGVFVGLAGKAGIDDFEAFPVKVPGAGDLVENEVLGAGHEAVLEAHADFKLAGFALPGLVHVLDACIIEAHDEVFFMGRQVVTFNAEPGIVDIAFRQVDFLKIGAAFEFAEIDLREGGDFGNIAGDAGPLFEAFHGGGAVINLAGALVFEAMGLLMLHGPETTYFLEGCIRFIDPEIQFDREREQLFRFGLNLDGGYFVF